jgi:hypothetical protein
LELQSIPGDAFEHAHVVAITLEDPMQQLEASVIRKSDEDSEDTLDIALEPLRAMPDGEGMTPAPLRKKLWGDGELPLRASAASGMKASADAAKLPGSVPPPASVAGSAGHTTLISPRLLEAQAAADAEAPAVAQAKIKPVVGWLAIVAGPGRGLVFPLTYGINPVGSRVEHGVRLGFGDTQISDLQALVIYDHHRRKFFVHHKGGRVATFLGGEPILKLTPIAPQQEIVMGRTKLRLVPLCGPDFDWTQK